MNILTRLTALTLMTAALHASGAETTLSLPKTLVANVLNQSFSKTEVLIDNYGAKHGNSWLEQNSYIRLPDGETRHFNIAEQVTRITKWRQWKHYVDDLRSQSVSVTAQGQGLRFLITFESQGEEIKGKCLRNGKECKLKMERDIHVDNARLSVDIQPVPLNNSVGFLVGDVDFSASLKIPNKLCQAVKKICDKIEGKIYKELKSQLEKTVRNELMRDKLRKQVAANIRPQIQASLSPLLKLRFGGYEPKPWEIIAIRDNGSQYQVTIRHPEVIDAGSVRIKQFKVKVPKQVLSCPANVEYVASIETDAAISGSAWVEYLHPSLGKLVRDPGNFKWSTQGKGTATSVIYSKWIAPKGVWKTSEARLALSWKGSNGQTHTLKSPLVTFQRKCSKTAGQITF